MDNACENTWQIWKYFANIFLMISPSWVAKIVPRKIDWNPKGLNK